MGYRTRNKIYFWVILIFVVVYFIAVGLWRLGEAVFG